MFYTEESSQLAGLHIYVRYKNKVKIGDLVRSVSHGILTNSGRVGIIIELIDHIEVPPVCKVLWASGDIGKEWTDDIEMVSGSRDA